MSRPCHNNITILIVTSRTSSVNSLCIHMYNKTDVIYVKQLCLFELEIEVVVISFDIRSFLA